MISYFQSLLPHTEGGKLPYWLLFISVVSIFNSYQTYKSKDLELTKKVYENESSPSQPTKPQVTHLSARTFGTWTLITSIVRFYGAYYVTTKPVYELVQFTFLVAAWHFGSEWLIYRTCKLGKGLAGPLIVSSVSTIWMFLQKDYYLGSA